MGRYCKPLEVYLHRNSSDLPFVIVELARLSKHSERLVNPLRVLALKNIRPMITPLLCSYGFSVTSNADEDLRSLTVDGDVDAVTGIGNDRMVMVCKIHLYF